MRRPTDEAARRAGLLDAAVTVLDVVHDHLPHEEPVLFLALPAIRCRGRTTGPDVRMGTGTAPLP
ncbi:hypothetical protein EAO69_24110 [Streptomyces sp. me109]|nr:hypothetical protein EAO69_24110 [Streptomyces sp. me109]